MKELIRQALEYAEQKHKLGLLVWDEIPEFADDKAAGDWWSTAAGDRETVYSIAGLYSQFPPQGTNVDRCREILEDELCTRYPQFCD